MRYAIHTVFTGYNGVKLGKIEKTDDLNAAIEAANIYIIDPDCDSCYIYDAKRRMRVVLCYEK